MAYCPDRGDVIDLDFEPQAGHEQGDRRPALVISPRSYNKLTSLVLVVPITRQVKGYPFEVPVPQNDHVEGVILADAIKNLDWDARNSELICKFEVGDVYNVLMALNRLIEQP